jgi:hypothetical protein
MKLLAGAEFGQERPVEAMTIKVGSAANAYRDR